MIYEERLGMDELRRAHALDKATETVSSYATADEVLDRARKFEDYLSGDTLKVAPDPGGWRVAELADTRGKDEVPEPPKVEVLVKPKKHDLTGSGDKCRLCLWNDLKKKLDES